MPLAISDPSGYYWRDDPSQHVVYTGTGGNIQEFYYVFADPVWRQNNLTLDSATQGGGPAPPAAGDPSGYT